MNTGDRELVARASRGDVEAFTKLVRANSSLVYRVALRILGDEDAQDASQEVWVRVWGNLKGFRAQSAFSTWLYRITVNTCLSLRRSQASRQQKTSEYSEQIAYHLPHHHLAAVAHQETEQEDPEALTLSEERKEEIQAALGRIRAEHRAALVLRHMEGLSYAEIAEVMGVPDGTAKGWVSRGRAAMLIALAEEEDSRRARKREAR
jgi:RNA polymerase sigma-70 factor (ECF subfamily)